MISQRLVLGNLADTYTQYILIHVYDATISEQIIDWFAKKNQGYVNQIKPH